MRLCGTRRVIRRALDHVRRVRNAHRFGIAFKRRRGFTAPRSLRLDGRWIDLRFPEELEIHGNFLECFVNDYYGLSHFGQAPGTILDIGANVGFFALAARVSVWTLARTPDRTHTPGPARTLGPVPEG